MARMRRAIVVIRWDGPDRPIRDVIETALDDLFEERLTANPKIVWADCSVEWQPKAKPFKDPEQFDGGSDG